MAVSPTTSSDPAGPPAGHGAAGAEPSDPRQAFRSALARYQTGRLAAIVQARGLETDAARPSTLATELTGHLDSPAAVAAALAGLASGSRLALSLFALTETSVWPFPGLCHALATLGVEPRPVILELLDRGLLALDAAPDPQPIEDFASRIEQGPPHALDLRVHPSVPQAVRVTRPEGKLTADAAAPWPASANRTPWSRRSGWGRSGSAWASSRSARPSRGRSTSETTNGSRATRSSPEPSATRSNRSPGCPPSGWRWPAAWG